MNLRDEIIKHGRGMELPGGGDAAYLQELTNMAMQYMRENMHLMSFATRADRRRGGISLTKRSYRSTPRNTTSPIPSIRIYGGFSPDGPNSYIDRETTTITTHGTQDALYRLSQYITGNPSHKITNRSPELWDQNHFFVCVRKRDSRYKVVAAVGHQKYGNASGGHFGLGVGNRRGKK